ncbi:carbohydrate kinase family protein [Thermotoga sp. KOL6]|uniref:carbohydrate kinase family protein n=1 Tax=Thermotoga sp. KOL6 TaxID=126741 RepID=UPI000C77E7B4|nr:carbohydrate kinase family protein [Thermotoga sp. KOL6]PLV59781.1 hypothetical protein AS005_00310 [Thermotoga sp. KOL6]
MKVACVGKINVDIVYPVDEIKINSNHISNYVKVSLGGKAANVSVALRKLDVSSVLIGAIGNDENGKYVSKMLRDFEVKAFLTMREEAKTGFTFVIVDKFGNNTMFNYLGANAELSVEDVQRFEKELLGAEIVYYQTSVSTAILSYLKSLKKTLFVELTDPVDNELLVGLDYVSLNEEEILRATKESNLTKAIKYLLKHGVRRLFVKLGEKGSVYADQEKIIHQKPFRVEVVDTTGAGDAFTAGCIYGLLKGFSIENILYFANKCGALTCCKLGTVEAFPESKELGIELKGCKDEKNGVQ